MYLREMTVLLLRQIKRELIINRQLIYKNEPNKNRTKPLHRQLTKTRFIISGVLQIMIRRIALLAMIPDQTLRRAETLAGLRMALLRFTVTDALLTFAPVHGIPPVTHHAAVTMRPRRQVPAGQAGAVVTAGVTVALARRALREMPAVRRTRARWQGVHMKSGT